MNKELDGQIMEVLGKMDAVRKLQMCRELENSVCALLSRQHIEAIEEQFAVKKPEGWQYTFALMEAMTAMSALAVDEVITTYDGYMRGILHHHRVKLRDDLEVSLSALRLSTHAIIEVLMAHASLMMTHGTTGSVTPEAHIERIKAVIKEKTRHTMDEIMKEQGVPTDDEHRPAN